MAVSISTGVQISLARSSAHTLYPLSPGNITSNTIASYGLLCRQPQPVGSGAGDIDREALGLEAALQRCSLTHLVFDYEYTHPRSLTQAS